MKNWPVHDSGKSLIDGHQLLRGIFFCGSLFAGLVPHGRVIRDSLDLGQLRPSARWRMQTRIAKSNQKSIVKKSVLSQNNAMGHMYVPTLDKKEIPSFSFQSSHFFGNDLSLRRKRK